MWGAGSTRSAVAAPPDRRAAILKALGPRSIVLVGMMGAGKTVMGRRLADHLKIEFLDSDCEIEAAAGMTIPEIFERHGETYFREREGRVVERLIRGGPRIVATGGGAFANAATRATIKAQAVSLWIKADFDVLMRRVRKRGNRPLLKTADPEKTLQDLMTIRYPLYAEADMVVVSRDGPHEVFVAEMLAVIEAHLCPQNEGAAASRNR